MIFSDILFIQINKPTHVTAFSIKVHENSNQFSIKLKVMYLCIKCYIRLFECSLVPTFILIAHIF